MAGARARVLCALLVLLYCAVQGFAVDFTVGDASGWAIGSDYTVWTTGKNFSVGDTLVFNYGGGHSVDEVSSADYSGCTVGNSLSSDSSGKTKITLTTAGTHYFICSVPGHCVGGMKVAVDVAAGTGGGGGGGSGTATPGSPSTPTPTTFGPPATTTPSSANTISGFGAIFVIGFTLFVVSFAQVLE